jgi:hypothetical protein
MTTRQSTTALPNNVTGATIGAAISTVVAYLLGTYVLKNAPDAVPGACSLIIVAGITYLGGVIEHVLRNRGSTGSHAPQHRVQPTAPDPGTAGSTISEG